MSDPSKIALGSLRAIAGEQDQIHREIMLGAIEDEIRFLFGGCRCERRLQTATCLPDDAGEAARMLLNRLHQDVTALCEYRGPRDGLGHGLAVAVERLTRLAGTLDEFDTE